MTILCFKPFLPVTSFCVNSTRQNYKLFSEIYRYNFSHDSSAFHSHLIFATARHELSEATETGQFFSFSLRFTCLGCHRLAFWRARKEKKSQRRRWNVNKMLIFPFNLSLAFVIFGGQTAVHCNNCRRN